MDLFGTVVIHIVMACAVLGAVAAIRNTDRGLGYEFMQGIYSIGPIFVPVAGVMASIPFLSVAIKTVCGPAFELVGADPGIAATTFIAVDMGGYPLRHWFRSAVFGRKVRSRPGSCRRPTTGSAFEWQAAVTHSSARSVSTIRLCFRRYQRTKRTRPCPEPRSVE